MTAIKGLRHIVRCAVLGGLVSIATVSTGWGQESTQIEALGNKVLLKADKLQYDRQTGVVSALGNVEITQNRRILRANELRYDPRTDSVTATGNVVILEPAGEVLFADSVELTDQMRNGTLVGLRGLLSDNSRFAANSAQRRDGNRTIMAKAVYSPCNICPDHPEMAPLWQLKAARVEHNNAAQRIDYKDVVLEVYGIPVAYSPFFSHPDPSVKRKSGFLPPTLGNDSELGTTLLTPYYYAIAPNKDFTFSPFLTTNEGPVLMAEYRQRTETGSFSLDGSVTRPRKRDNDNQEISGRETRGHIRGSGAFDINETWRWGFNLFRASDDTYLRRYNISGETTLTSSLFLEGIRGRNYAAARAWSFQHLTEETGDKTGIILPLLEYSYIGEPRRYGDRFSVDASFLSLQRRNGTDSRRLSIGGGWRLPYIGPMGDIYTLNASVRGDVYYANSVIDPLAPTAPDQDGFAGRIWPKVSLDWRYPFMRYQGNIKQTIEPIVQGIITPNGGNPDKIPNEDSQSLEFDDTNLFSDERFPGLDRVEGGFRVNYGLKAGVYGSSGYSTIMVGQTYRLQEDDTFESATGLRERLSDYVGRIVIAPSPYFELTHRFRLSRRTLELQRNEIAVSAGPSRWKLNASYVKLSDELSTDNLGEREELAISGNARLSKYWSVNAYDRIDLTDNGGTLVYGGGLTYEDECVSLKIGYERTFTRDRDAAPTSIIGIQLRLRNLG